MTTKIQKWGNSLAVRLPKKLITRLNLREGSEVVVDEHEKNVLIKRVVLRQQRMGKNSWKRFVVPAYRRRENVSGNIDKILYGKPH